DDVVITQTPRAGWAVATEGGATVALETEITPELRREGLAREVIRLVQDARKNDGLHVSDRIRLWWEAAGPDLAEALAEHGGLIADEVLAVELGRGAPGAAASGAGAGGQQVFEHADGDLGLVFWLQRS
ncbi:MAG TPA: DUF5915 domain-containing protein, partial [Streptosporangiaceae bacterium]|nr:DUF5915 domain-containing protein [Streptosporangiaceae bacterium]